MGMYTELVLKCEVKKDLPPEVESVLQRLFGNDNDDVPYLPLPPHEFFACGRWSAIGRCSSYYHVPFATSRYAEGYIFSRSDLKNYEGEIDKFIDWISPYLKGCDGTCIGWKWYEEDDMPILLYKGKA